MIFLGSILALSFAVLMILLRAAGIIRFAWRQGVWVLAAVFLALVILERAGQEISP